MDWLVPGGTESGERLTDFTTATAPDDGSREGDAASTATTDAPPFSFTIDAIEGCGPTRRDVTATLHHN